MNLVNKEKKYAILITLLFAVQSQCTLVDMVSGNEEEAEIIGKKGTSSGSLFSLLLLSNALYSSNGSYTSAGTGTGTSNGTSTGTGAATGELMLYATLGSFGGSSNTGGYINPAKELDITIDKSGNLFVADRYNNRILKVDSSITVTSYAGTGQTGSQDGSASSASFNLPSGITTDNFGNVFVVDSENYTIRKISTDKIVTTWAGSGEKGRYGSASRTDGAGTAASFCGPQDIAADNSGNMYVVEWRWICSYPKTFRKITSSAVVTTISNADTNFYQPSGIAVNKEGNIYIIDPGLYYNKVFKITPNGSVTSLPNNNSNFYPTSDIAVDSQENSYITGSQYLYKIDRNGNYTQLPLHYVDVAYVYPSGLTIDSSDNLYVSDPIKRRIYKMKVN
jgi:sugar lactone lactonase YvrE